MKNTRKLITCGILGASTLAASHAMAESLLEDTKLDFRLRYEAIDEENPLGNADALTLRTTLGVKFKEVNGWSAFVELEDVRSVLGVDEYNNAIGQNAGVLSVIPDPETTEFDQGYVQYKSDVLTAKIGRQMITLDDHRFIGSVIWRQDKQTFDAVSVNYKPTEKLNIFLAQVSQRNRIFAEERDQDSNDTFFNASYQTGYGKLTAYSYLLDLDDVNNELDSYGVAFRGSRPAGDLKIHYLAEFATQESTTDSGEFDADFYRFEGGVTVSGVTVKAGLESLGSDDGQYAFQTPLSTLHKFNGWTDKFLVTPNVGLVDAYVQASGKLYGGSWIVRYHDYTADDETDTLDNLGTEFELQYTKKFKNGIYTGLKAAFYSADDFAVDEDAMWAWIGKTF